MVRLSNWEKWKRSLRYGFIFMLFLIIFAIYLKAPGILLTVFPIILSKRLMYSKKPGVSFLIPLIVFVVLFLLSGIAKEGGDFGEVVVFVVLLIWTGLLYLCVLIMYFLHKNFEK